MNDKDDKNDKGAIVLKAPDVAEGAPPIPKSKGSLYLIGLLAKQDGLDIARDALIARAGEAGPGETAYIKTQLAEIQLEYLKIDAWINAYLAKSTIYRTITPDGLAAIRDIVEHLQGVTSKRETAADIIQLVTKLLNEWDGQAIAPGGKPVPGAAPDAGVAAGGANA